MQESFKAIKISEKVFWVGAIDRDLREFHGYATPRGTTYNAFLIIADKVTLVDTVKAPFKDELLSRIKSVIDPEKITYIISNHSEMDHTGCLPEIIEAVKPEKVFASKMGKQALNEHFHFSDDVISPLKTGDSLNLGEVNLSFIETRMLHWPDSMFTYLNEEELLFSQDGFGMHLANDGLFADKISDDILKHEAAKYYANILLPFSNMVLKLLNSVEKQNLSFKIIAPDHGPIRRQSPGKILGMYRKWAEQKPTNKVVITFDTMWGSTEKMARAIADGVTTGGGEPMLLPLKSNHRTDVATELLDAGGFIVGSPTMNNELYPTVADVLVYIKGLKKKNLIGAAFGSYGWSGESIKHISEHLAKMGVEIVGESKVKYVPTEQALKNCFELGKSVAQKLVNNLKTKN